MTALQPIAAQNAIDPPMNGISRREFLARAACCAGGMMFGGSAFAAAPRILATSDSAGVAAAGPAAVPGGGNRVRELVKTLYHGLTEKQKALVFLPFDHRRRRLLGNNWWIVKPTIGEVYTPDQQELMKEIIKQITSEQGYEKFFNVMETDSGGYKNYHAALFGDPDSGKFEWVLSGRHLTIRADANSVENAALGGPILYGHAPVTFHEAPDHPKNVFWYQAKRANEAFGVLDGKQRERALIEKMPVEEAVRLQGPNGKFPGLAVSEMSRDQKEEIEKVLSDLMLPFAKADVDEVRACMKAGGGVDALHLAFYKEGDIGNDKVWDIWRVEGPNFVWYFRGEPHVHTWVNIAQSAPGTLLEAKPGNLDAEEF